METSMLPMSSLPKKAFANPIKRFLAFLVDAYFFYFVYWILVFILINLIGFLAIVVGALLGVAENRITTYIGAFGLALTFLWPFAFIFYSMLTTKKFGATLGKKCLHIKTVAMDGSEISTKSLWIRNIPKSLIASISAPPGFILLGYNYIIVLSLVGSYIFICAVFSTIHRYRCTPHDLLAKTVVIKA